MKKPHNLSQVTEVEKGRGEGQSVDSSPMSSAEQAAPAGGARRNQVWLQVHLMGPMECLITD